MNMTIILTDTVTILSSSQTAESCCFHGSLVRQPCHFDPWGPTRSFSMFLAWPPAPGGSPPRHPRPEALGRVSLCPLEGAHNSWYGLGQSLRYRPTATGSPPRPPTPTPPPLWAEGNLPTPALIAWGLWNTTQFPDPFPPLPAPSIGFSCLVGNTKNA